MILGGKMSKFGRKVVRRMLRRVIKKAAKKKGFAKMVKRGKRVKSINFARPDNGGIMLT